MNLIKNRKNERFYNRGKKGKLCLAKKSRNENLAQKYLLFAYKYDIMIKIQFRAEKEYSSFPVQRVASQAVSAIGCEGGESAFSRWLKG